MLWEPRRAGACRQESGRGEGSAAGLGGCRCRVGRCLKQGLPGEGGEESRPPLKRISRPNWKVRVSGRRFGVRIAPFHSLFRHLGNGAGNVSPPSFVPLPVCSGKEPTRGQAAPEADRPGRPCRKGLRCSFKKPRHIGTHLSALRQDKEPGDGPGCAGSPPRRLARRRTGHHSRFGAVGGRAFPAAPFGFCPLSSPKTAAFAAAAPRRGPELLNSCSPSPSPPSPSPGPALGPGSGCEQINEPICCQMNGLS